MKKTAVYPWETNEVYHLERLLKEHPEWTDSTVCNQFKYQCNFTKHTSKAIRSKINTLRPNKCKSKWKSIARTKLASKVRAIDLSVADLMQAKDRVRPATADEVKNCHWINLRTATEMCATLAEQEHRWQATQREVLIQSIIHVSNATAQLMVDTLKAVEKG